MTYLGTTYTRRQIEALVGNVAQIGGTRSYELSEGASRGTRAVDVNTGAGLSFTVLPDRGMDISGATWRGVNLVFRTPNGEVHPSHYSPAGNDWLRTFFGGLLTTCGLSSFGPPCEDDGEILGLHGRANVTPAVAFQDRSGWEGDGYAIDLRGTVEEASVFGRRLRLERRILARIGEPRLAIEDRVTNFGFAPSPFVILYHINPGFPLLDDRSRLLIASRHCEAYEEYTRGREAEADRFGAPRAGYREENYLHTVSPGVDGRAIVGFVNPGLDGGTGLTVGFDTSTLPYLSEWKMLGQGDYVVGIEPCNAPVVSRAELRRRSALPELAAGESRLMRVELGVVSGERELAALAERVAAPAGRERG